MQSMSYSPCMSDEAGRATARAAIADRVRAMASSAGSRAGHIESSALVAFLYLSAIGGVSAAAAGLGGAPGSAVAGGFGALGAGYIAEALSRKAERLRTGSQDDGEDLDDSLVRDLTELLNTDGDDADGLRSEIARELKEIGAVEVAVRAAIESGDMELVEQIHVSVEQLASTFTDFDWVIAEFQEVMMLILRELSRQGTIQHMMVDRLGATEDALREMTVRLHTRIGANPETADLHVAVSNFGKCPYRGLLAFREQDSHVFFGREMLTATLVSQLARRLTHGGLLVVTGASGAGKSSLLRAGLFAAIARGALGHASSERWPRFAITPTGDPLGQLAAGVAVAVDADEASLRALLDASPRNFDSSLASVMPSQAVLGGRVIIVVDQFEEVFSPECTERQRRAFIGALHSASTSTSGPTGMPLALVLIVVRSDFLDNCADYDELRAPVDEAFTVRALSDSQLRRAITEPARTAGAVVDPDLVDTLLRELRSSVSTQTGLNSIAGALPLLSHALAETWQMRVGSRLTTASYGQTGGIEHAVATSAEDVYERLSGSEQEAAKEIFIRLVAVGDDGLGVSSPATRDELATWLKGLKESATAAAVERFAQRRLLTVDGNIVQLAHEAMIHSWSRLGDWLADDREFQMWRARTHTLTRRWAAEHYDDGYLLRGRPLLEAYHYCQARESSAGPDINAFVNLSIAVEVSSHRTFTGSRSLDTSALREALNICTGLDDPILRKKGARAGVGYLLDQFEPLRTISYLRRSGSLTAMPPGLWIGQMKEVMSVIGPKWTCVMLGELSVVGAVVGILYYLSALALIGFSSIPKGNAGFIPTAVLYIILSTGLAIIVSAASSVWHTYWTRYLHAVLVFPLLLIIFDFLALLSLIGVPYPRHGPLWHSRWFCATLSGVILVFILLILFQRGRRRARLQPG
jgi:hypothetical protein